MIAVKQFKFGGQLNRSALVRRSRLSAKSASDGFINGARRPGGDRFAWRMDAARGASSSDGPGVLANERATRSILLSLKTIYSR